MSRAEKRSILWHILLILTIVFAIAMFPLSAKETHAAAAGFKTINGKTYYIRSDGSKQKGWLTLNGKRYYFNKSTGVQKKGWQKNSQGMKIRYFTSGTGAMATGYLKDSKGNVRFFNKSTGIMVRGWYTENGYKYYFYAKSGIRATGLMRDSKNRYRLFRTNNGRMVTGWHTSAKGYHYYFHKNSGVMYTGLKKIGGKYYYFKKTNGIRYEKGFGKVGSKIYYFSTQDGHAQTGWLSLDGKKYYFSSTGVMYKSRTASIDGTTYQFDANGVATEKTSAKRTFTVFDSKNNRHYTLMNEYNLHPGIADGSKTDLDILAAVCESEAGDQGLEGMEAAAMTILNRTIIPDKDFPSSVRYVVYQGSESFAQYSVVTNGALLKRLNGQFEDRTLAYQAAKKAMSVFNAYVTKGTKRTIKGFKKKDFDFMYFMTEPAFWAQNLTFSKVDYEIYKEHVFFVDWV